MLVYFYYDHPVDKYGRIEIFGLGVARGEELIFDAYITVHCLMFTLYLTPLLVCMARQKPTQAHTHSTPPTTTEPTSNITYIKDTHIIFILKNLR